jgi:hypothetical protein
MYFRAKVAALDQSRQPALGAQTLDKTALLPTGHEVQPGWYATRIDDALVLDAAMFQREWRSACNDHEADRAAAATAATTTYDTAGAPGFVKQAALGDDEGTWETPWVQRDLWPTHTSEVRASCRAVTLKFNF